jgi:preprotein translocase subunit SecF
MKKAFWVSLLVTVITGLVYDLYQSGRGIDCFALALLVGIVIWVVNW